MKIEQRLFIFIVRTNWVLLLMSSTVALFLSPRDFSFGVISGGLIVTANFHLLYRTLKKSLIPPHLSSHQAIIAKFYLRFIVSGFVIFVLISRQLVDPVGLILGLSVVVVSIILATFSEFKRLIFEEAI